MKPEKLHFLVLSTMSILGIVLLSSAYAQEDNVDSEMPNFLAIQHAESGSISEINATTYSFQLNDVSEKTILFANRPDRIVTTQNIEDFVTNWTTGQDSFQVDPPNAALVMLEGDEQKQDTYEIELFNPRYDKAKKTLEYDLNFIGDIRTTTSDSSNTLGKSVLIIDSFPTAVNDQITD